MSLNEMTNLRYLIESGKRVKQIAIAMRVHPLKVYRACWAQEISLKKHRQKRVIAALNAGETRSTGIAKHMRVSLRTAQNALLLAKRDGVVTRSGRFWRLVEKAEQ